MGDEPVSAPAAEIPGRADAPSVAAGLLTATIIIAGLYVGRDVLIPVTLAFLLSFVLAPVVDALRRLKLPKIAAIGVAVLIAIGAVSVIGTVIGGQLAGLARDVPKYAQTIETKVERVRTQTVGKIAGRIESLAGRLSQFGEGKPAGGAPRVQRAPDGTVTRTTVRTVSAAPPSVSPLSVVERVVGPVLGPLATLGIVFVIAIFVLAARDDLRDRLLRLFGAGDLHRTTVALDDAAARLSRYFLSQVAVNTSFGCVIGIGLALIGVPSPVLWGILAALLRFIPYIGSFLSVVLPAALAAAIEPGWTSTFWVVGLFAVVELVTGQLIEPMLYGRSTGLSPLAVVIAAIFWAALWGTVGLLLSTPLTLCFVVLGRHFEALQFLDILLGDRPALTPAESFYQRLLAADPDELLDQAEQSLKSLSLTSYYDGVVVPGLQLAAADARRGVLEEDKLDRIDAALAALLRDLDDRPDREPPPPARDGALGVSITERNAGAPDRSAPPATATAVRGTVLCVAGRGRFDDCAAAILVQLLGKHGIVGQQLRYDAVRRDATATLETDGVAMICVTYLDLDGSPAHLRYLLQRLRQRAPGVALAAGLWPDTARLPDDADARSALGVDQAARSFAAIVACVVERVGTATA